MPVPIDAAPQTGSAPAPATGQEVIRSIKVTGNQRLEPETVESYIALHVGDTYTREAGDTALKALYATELFADVTIKDENAGDIVIAVRENPVVNRIVLEGNKRLKSDKIMPEIKLAAREIFTRSKVRADVGRIIDLYRRQGRYAATVDPQMVLLDQNRVDVVFEIHEGDKSKVKRINIIGNDHFSDGELKGQMATKEATLTHFLSSGTSYDPDRLAYDQQKLRQFYLTQGYADFRVVSAVAELTPDKKDFIITYVVEEGKRYKFGDINVVSDIRDLKPDVLKTLIKVKPGDWYNAKTVEDTVDAMTETAGLLGYAFANIDPDFKRDGDKLTMGVTFNVKQTPRVYVERVDINGNTLTQDKVVRREFRLAEGDAFNGFLVKRSRDRIRSLGYFQDKLEIDQKPGSAPDKVVLEANVQEKSTGQLQVSAGYSSLEKFIVNLSIEQNNFRGKGQTVRASADWSLYSKSVSTGFTEPYPVRQERRVRLRHLPPRLQVVRPNCDRRSQHHVQRDDDGFPAPLRHPADRILVAGDALRAQPGQGDARQEHLLQQLRGHQRRRRRQRPACLRPDPRRPLSLRCGRQPDDLVGRLQRRLRQSEQPAHAVEGQSLRVQPGFRGSGRQRQISAHHRVGRQISRSRLGLRARSPCRGGIHPAVRRAAL